MSFPINLSPADVPPSQIGVFSIVVAIANSFFRTPFTYNLAVVPSYVPQA